MDGMTMPTQARDTLDHLNHVVYPASKQDLVEACNKMSDVPESDKKWFTENLPNRVYGNASEVKEALGFTV